MIRLDRAEDYLDEGKYKKAIRLLKDIVKKEPNYYQAYLLQASNYWKLEDKVKKEEALKKAVEVAPLEPEVYYRYGDFLSGNKRKAFT